MNLIENKNIFLRKKWKAFLFVFFAVLSLHFFVEKAYASGDCYCRTNSDKGYLEDAGSPYKVGTDAQETLNDLEPLCKAKCASVNQTIYCLSWLNCGNGRTIGDKCVDGSSDCKAGVGAATSAAAAPAAKAVVEPIAAALEAVIKGFLFGVLRFLGLVFGFTATLFQYLLDPVNISGAGGLLNKPAVREVWIMVRDTLNMVFILILLFAAFCTVFQVEKWNLKKVWLSILINALLVNFSYPIARFFIDVSNVAMYYFLNNMFTGSGQGSGSSIMAGFGDASGLSSILTPEKYQTAEISYIIAAIVFTFILGMTMFVLAALFVVRLVALVMIVMFSPIGFVGNIFPEMSKFANDWWTNLFKYAFFGPIMVFMMMVSIRIMRAMPDNLTAAAQLNSSAGEANWIAKAAFYAIPIMIMWISMGIAQKMGIQGADKVVGFGKKWGGKVAMFASGAGFAKKQWEGFKSKREERKKEIVKKNFGSKLGEKINDKQDKDIATLGLTKKQREDGKNRYNSRRTTKNKDDIKKKSEEFDGEDDKILHDDIKLMNNVAVNGMDQKALIAAAGKVKQALSRGSSFEKEIERELKTVTAGTAGLSGAIKPPDVSPAVITAAMNSAQIAMERDREKAEKDALDKWVQNEKVEYMKQARYVIKQAEEKGKLI